jgi:three-Cys-motif partner protein
MAPRDVVWPLEPHTRGKHEVLRRYLDAWFPILGSWAGRILFIDGFAGPGEYAGGEPGSPLIALKSFLDHSSRNVVRAQVLFLFIEKDPERAAHLEQLVQSFQPRLPPGCEVRVHPGTFDASMNGVLDQLESSRAQLGPAFLMVDPFGVSETPMSVIRRILAEPQCEVYVSFMSEFIGRFRATAEFGPHLDELFGTVEWRNGIDIGDSVVRKDFFYDLYERQLREAGAKQVVRFELYHGNRLVYAIFFATQSTKGSDRMKQAIWKVAPFGDFSFRGTHSDQLVLGVDQPDLRPLRAALRERFGGLGWVAVEEVLDFVASDQTDFHTGQLKTDTLKPMEQSSELEVDPESRKKRRTYPPGTRLRF